MYVRTSFSVNTSMIIDNYHIYDCTTASMKQKHVAGGHPQTGDYATNFWNNEVSD